MTGGIEPKLIIHGGAGSAIKSEESLIAVRHELHQIVETVYQKLAAGEDAKSAVVLACRLLEDNPRFNAGTGSVLQSDGQIRMSAALMDGAAQRFSGVINASRLQHPIDLAEHLQTFHDRVLSDYGAADLMRELGTPLFDPLTELRLQEWLRERSEGFKHEMAGVVAESALANSSARRGTIGVVALDNQGRIAAGTSTGGKGLERIGRVSDSAMPAGNYATADAGISCTGIGEDIIDECLAARIVIRVTDGMALSQAFDKSFAEADRNQREFGAIGIDRSGRIAWGKTTEVLLSAYHNGYELGDALEMGKGTKTASC